MDRAKRDITAIAIQNSYYKFTDRRSTVSYPNPTTQNDGPSLETYRYWYGWWYQYYKFAFLLDDNHKGYETDHSKDETLLPKQAYYGKYYESGRQYRP